MADLSLTSLPHFAHGGSPRSSSEYTLNGPLAFGSDFADSSGLALIRNSLLFIINPSATQQECARRGNPEIRGQYIDFIYLTLNPMPVLGIHSALNLALVIQFPQNFHQFPFLSWLRNSRHKSMVAVGGL